ncbi:MAG: hypothetical protein PHG45_05890 [Dehalococcoidales bacterium]|nr:hypothetical protein [Dehalococcoidales bacterium]
MKLSKIIKCFHRKQNGHVFITALIILTLGSAMLAPLLGFIGTGLKTGQAFEEQTDLLYAADAGIENAIWQIQNGGVGIINGLPGFFEDSEPAEGTEPVPGLPPYPILDEENNPVNMYDSNGALIELFDEEGNPIGVYDEDGNPVELYDGNDNVIDNVVYDTVFYRLAKLLNGSLVDVEINGCVIDVKLTRISNYMYIVHSIASDEEKNTSVEVFFEKDISNLKDFGDILNYALITPEGSKGIILKGEFDAGSGKGMIEDYDGDWPTANDLISFYIQDVSTSDSYQNLTLILSNDTSINNPFYRSDALIVKNNNTGTFYRDGDFTISNNASSKYTLMMESDIYITGKTVLEATSVNKSWVLDLNGYTLFIASEAGVNDQQLALEIQKEVVIKGPGAIIAVGDISAQPKSYIGEDGGPIFLMSVSGLTELKPKVDFSGGVAGTAEIKLYSNAYVAYPDTPGGLAAFGLNFPTSVGQVSWITRQYVIE